MLMFSLEEILKVTGGVLVGHDADTSTSQEGCVAVSTDTRTIHAGDLFVALIGERFDGHSFLKTACENGCSIALISDSKMLPKTMTGILVRDTLIGLHDLARAYRRKLSAKVIAVTGSVGKTSTREMLLSAFSGSKRIHATKHNLNNEIGLPLTILSAPQDTELLLLEMGMRMKGEIEQLSMIAEPDVAIITNIGVSHIERLGSREAIRDAKLEICAGLKSDGVLLYSGNDELLPEYLMQNPMSNVNSLGKVLDEGSRDDESADYAIRAIRVQTFHEMTSFLVEVRRSKNSEMEKLCEFVVPVPGKHHVRNAMFAILSAVILGIPMDSVAKGLTTFHPTGSRGRIIRTERYLLIDDAYNASPESMAAAFESLHLLAAPESRRKIAAIGGVLELGTFSKELHTKIGRSAASFGIDCLYVCGEDADCVREGAQMAAPNIYVKVFETREDLTAAILKEIRPGDAILAKGSHAFSMHKVIEEILASIPSSDLPEGNSSWI